MFKLLTVLVYCFLFISSSAQVSSLNGLNDYMSIEQKFSTGSKNFGDAIYVTDGWVKGRIVFINGAKLNDAMFRYNAFDEILELNYSSAVYELKRDKLSEFEYVEGNTKSIIKYRMISNDKKDLFPAQVLTEGKIVLCSRNKMKIGRSTSGGTGMQALDPVKETLELVRTFYVLKDDGVVVKVLQTKKSILNILNDKSDLVELYMKNQNINIRNEKEFAMVFGYYNSIQ